MQPRWLGGPATAAGLDRPHGATVAATNNHRIRKLVRQG